MTDLEKRIKLAEAMFPELWVTEEWLSAKKDGCRGINLRPLPDPFSSADDDYLVLEWMRSPIMYGKGFVYTKIFTFLGSDYKIGDYARAALEVINAT